jgi:hypothetical protein
MSRLRLADEAGAETQCPNAQSDEHTDPDDHHGAAMVETSRRELRQE